MNAAEAAESRRMNQELDERRIRIARRRQQRHNRQHQHRRRINHQQHHGRNALSQWWINHDIRQLFSGAAQLFAVTLVLMAASSKQWIVGEPTDSNDVKYKISIGLLYSVYTFQDARGELNFRNQDDYLRGGEAVLIFIVAGVMAGIVSSTLTFLLFMHKLRSTRRFAHACTVWCAFVTGLSFIVGSITYTAAGPSAEDKEMNYGSSFIITLTTGFFVLINGLLLVLSRQPEPML